mgnify:CR=1 FL=1
MVSQEHQQPPLRYSATSSDDNILVVDDLHTSFFTRDGEVKAVNGLNINLKENTILGVVGLEHLYQPWLGLKGPALITISLI